MAARIEEGEQLPGELTPLDGAGLRRQLETATSSGEVHVLRALPVEQRLEDSARVGARARCDRSRLLSHYGGR